MISHSFAGVSLHVDFSRKEQIRLPAEYGCPDDGKVCTLQIIWTTSENKGMERNLTKLSQLILYNSSQTADYTGLIYKASLNFADDESKKRNYKNIFVPTKCLKVTNIPSGKSGNDVSSFFAQKGIGVRIDGTLKAV